jgi:uncharacterized protein YeeX (DUF496 family)
MQNLVKLGVVGLLLIAISCSEPPPIKQVKIATQEEEKAPFLSPYYYDSNPVKSVLKDSLFFHASDFRDKGFAGLIRKLKGFSLSLVDFNDISSLAKRIRDAKDPVSKYINSQFPPSLVQELGNYKEPISEELQESIVIELNRVMKNPALYTENTKESPKPNLAHEEDWVHLNRMLLESTYLEEIAKTRIVNQDKVSRYLQKNLSEEALQELYKYNGTVLLESKTILLNELNRLLQTPIYEQKRFVDANAKLSKETQNLLDRYNSYIFRPEEFKNISSLVAKIKDPKQDPVSAYLKESFPAKMQRDLSQDIKSVTAAFQDVFVKELNLLIQAKSLYAPERFKYVPLSEEMKKQAAQELTGEDLARTNRSLMEAAYPEEIAAKENRSLEELVELNRFLVADAYPEEIINFAVTPNTFPNSGQLHYNVSSQVDFIDQLAEGDVIGTQEKGKVEGTMQTAQLQEVVGKEKRETGIGRAQLAESTMKEKREGGKTTENIEAWQTKEKFQTGTAQEKRQSGTSQEKLHSGTSQEKRLTGEVKTDIVGTEEKRKLAAQKQREEYQNLLVKYWEQQNKALASLIDQDQVLKYYFLEDPEEYKKRVKERLKPRNVLQLKKEAPSSIQPGEPFKYRLSLTNMTSEGENAADVNNVFIFDTLPSRLFYEGKFSGTIESQNGKRISFKNDDPAKKVIDFCVPNLWMKGSLAWNVPDSIRPEERIEFYFEVTYFPEIGILKEDTKLMDKPNGREKRILEKDKTVVRVIKYELPRLFNENDFSNLPGLLGKLRDGQDAVSQYLKEKLSSKMQQDLATYQASTPSSEPVEKAFLQDFNRLIQQKIYKADLFKVVPDGVKQRFDKDPKEEELIQANRSLLAKVYPGEIVIDWLEVSVKIQASPEAERGYILGDLFEVKDAKDATDRELMFQRENGALMQSPK